MSKQTQAERIAEQAAANTAEVKFWFEDGSYAGVAVRNEDGAFDCYSRSDIFVGCAGHLLACRELLIF